MILGDGRRGSRILLGAIVIALAAATAFGLWHVVVGGLVNANPRAGTFGLALAATGGALLAAVIVGRRRLGRR